MTLDEARREAGKLLAAARQGKLAGPCVLGGEEDYLVHHTGAALVAVLCPGGKSDLALTRLAAADVRLGEVAAALGARGLFGGRPVVHLRGLRPEGRGAGLAGDLGRWLKEHPAPPGGPLLIVELAGKLAASHPLAQAAAAAVEFPALVTYDLGTPGKDPAHRWAVQYLAERGSSIEADAFELLRRRAANSLWALAGELDKLAAHAGPGQPVRLADVRAVVAWSWEDQVFDLIEAVGNRQAERALAIQIRLLESGTDPLEIQRLLARQIRLLLQARGAYARDELPGFRSGMKYWNFRGPVHQQIVAGLGAPARLRGGLAGLHPFPFFRVLEQAVRFEDRVLIEGLEALLVIERAVKTGTGDGRQLLELFILHLIDGAPRRFLSDVDPLV